MLEKLRGIEARYEDIQAQLADPAAYADSALLRRLTREQKEALKKFAEAMGESETQGRKDFFKKFKK